ncbi:hypothetical protein [Hoylesella shahii]|uniref:hypothetical protein n=1 Tax=Hoylesella shahii TaxID=228603 RepID=UPI0028EEBC00|nr:hypothetical protein [Hoylesella shahii]
MLLVIRSPNSFFTLSAYNAVDDLKTIVHILYMCTYLAYTLGRGLLVSRGCRRSACLVQ